MLYSTVRCSCTVEYFKKGNSVLGGVSSTIDLNQEKTSVALEMRSSLMAMSCAAGKCAVY